MEEGDEDEGNGVDLEVRVRALKKQNSTTISIISTVFSLCKKD